MKPLRFTKSTKSTYIRRAKRKGIALRGFCVRCPYLTPMIRKYQKVPQMKRKRCMKLNRKREVQDALQAATQTIQTRTEIKMTAVCGQSSVVATTCSIESMAN